MDPRSIEFQKTVSELRARALSESSDLDVQLKKALDPRYWLGLNATMNIGGEKEAEGIENSGASSSLADSSLRMLSASGYFQMPGLIATPVTEKMRSAFDCIRAAGWPPVFSFVYDEFWSVFRGPTLVQFLTSALGENYGQLPYIWGHYVAPDSKGWPPHVDGPSALKKLTVWMALSEATLENGCMYVVRRNPETEAPSDFFLNGGTLNPADVPKLLQYTKALPAAAGSCMGWRPNVIHWGSASSPAATPRLSISVEFAQPQPGLQAEAPKLLESAPVAPLPSFAMRLHLIASAIKRYERFEPGLLRHLNLAKQIARHTSAESA